MDIFFNKKQYINCNGQLLNIAKPIVMGILNITPDSFFDGGNYHNTDKIKQQIQKMTNEGVSIIDIGAYSSRPGAINISEKEELKRLIPVLEIILKDFPNIFISVDTFRSNIAKIVVNNYGVSIINDISAGELDNKMFNTISKLNVPYIIMHMKGNPKNMQTKATYKNLIKEIISYFDKKIHILKGLGVKDIIIDPGFGFSKTLSQNYEILKKLNNLQILGSPILVGMSRKSMIYKYLNTKPENALNGTSILNTIALQQGIDILRVHDVKQANETIKLIELTK